MNPDRAIIRFALKELDSVGRRVVYRLRRIPASGIYGDDIGLRSLWDEFCFEQRNGPTDQLELDWNRTLWPYLCDAVDRLPNHTARLLSWHLASFEEGDPDDAIHPAGLRDAIRTTVEALAIGSN